MYEQALYSMLPPAFQLCSQLLLEFQGLSKKFALYDVCVQLAPESCWTCKLIQSFINQCNGIVKAPLSYCDIQLVCRSEQPILIVRKSACASSYLETCGISFVLLILAQRLSASDARTKPFMADVISFCRFDSPLEETDPSALLHSG